MTTIYDAVLPDLPGITATAVLNPRRSKQIDAAVDAGGKAVVYDIPATGVTVEAFAAFVRRTRRRVIRAAAASEETGCHISRKELVSGEGFRLFGINHRLNIADGAPVPAAAHEAPTWSSKSWHLTVDRPHLSAKTIIEWYRQQGQQWLDKTVPALARRAGVATGPDGLSWAVRPYKTGENLPGSWARCHPGRVFYTHWMIFQFPREYAEHIVQHELAHAMTPGDCHGKPWQAAMDRLCGHSWRDTEQAVKTGRKLRIWAGDVLSGPFPAAASVRVCDVGGEDLTGRGFWMLNAAGKGWEGNQGALCAGCASRPEPAPVSARPAAPTRYSAAIQAAAERQSAATPFVSSWAHVEAGTR